MDDQSFFFSSRRRHTRFSRDWSSDVCSSDLPWEVTDPEKRKVPESFLLKGGQGFPIAYVPAPVGPTTAQMSANNYFCLTNCAQQGNKTPLTRSEERRVGKECRTRWSSKHEKK